MKDIIEFFKCIFLQGAPIPVHCLDPNVESRYTFPLGKRTLESKLNSQESLQTIAESEYEKSYDTDYIDQLFELNLDLQETNQRLKKQLDEINLIHGYLILFLLLFIVLFLFFKSQTNGKRTHFYYKMISNKIYLTKNFQNNLNHVRYIPL